MNIQFLRQEAADELFKNISNNIKLYAEEKEPWIENYYLTNNIKLPIITSDMVLPEIELVTGSESSNDAENAIRFHQGFKGLLKPVQATDKRLWIALTHNTYYGYMCSRWPVENKLNDNDTNGTVTDRYFTSRGFLRNGIARLYWIPELTFDDTLEDPYELTRFLLSNQDLINQVDGRSFCRNKTILQSCLKTLKGKGQLTENQKRLFFEKMCKKGGVTVLDALPVESLDKLCNDTLKESLEIKRIVDGCKVLLQSTVTDKYLRVEIQKGKAVLGKSPLKTKPDTLYRLTLAKEVELAGVKYKIVEIIEPQ